jgi:hypothetical protein
MRHDKVFAKMSNSTDLRRGNSSATMLEVIVARIAHVRAAMCVSDVVRVSDMRVR